MLESLGSARIEGNNTTLADYVESRLLDQPATLSDQLREMDNIETCMRFIESNVAPGQAMSEHFVRELHAMAVQGLQREGDRTPGAYRLGQVQIAQSQHLPPAAIAVPQYMRELMQFLNHPHSAKYDLMKVALAHHRFAWVHPFSNGNGRCVRLLTYALLIKFGFNVQAGGRVLNPTAVFCNDRDQYYAMLTAADTGTVEGREAWCVYVLSGMLQELRKVDQLTNADYVTEQILAPALRYSREREWLTAQEERVLQRTAKLGVTKASDLKNLMPDWTERQRSYQISKLVERGLLAPIRPDARQYTVGFMHNSLLRGVIHALTIEGFIPDALHRP
jgi:Fic family protein